MENLPFALWSFLWLFAGLVTVALLVVVLREKWARWRGKRPPIVTNADLLAVLSRLPAEQRELVFERYAKLFGAGAARYARKTYTKWQSGKVRPRRSTAERFLVRLPEAMSFELKCEILRQLRAEFCAPDHYEINAGWDDWREKVTPLADAIIAKARTAALPQAVIERLAWLASRQAQAAHALLAAAQEQESRLIAATVEEDFARLEDFARRTPGARITHTIRLPFGAITVKIK
jgi:hypothetical protein